jgi:lipopolysaccharide transport system ATP-binding protein
MAVIQVTNVSKRFLLHPNRPRSFLELVVGLTHRQARRPATDFWALRDVSFAIKAGEMLGIIGSNGSGKSTCLKLLTRIIEPTLGTIKIQGRVAALLELGTGFHPELTGRENIYLNGSVLGMPRREMARRFDDIVGFAELERFIDIPVKFYSSGMYVRLAFANAIHVDPDVLLVDEVLAVGDQSFQEKCLERINELKRSGMTIVFVSHSFDAVRSLCTRAIWLDRGELREDGITESVIARYLEHIHAKEEAAAFVARDAERARLQTTPATTTGQVTSKAPAPAEATVAEQPAAAASAPAEEPADPVLRQQRRWGTREAEITAVRFLDREGREHLTLQTGQSVTIVLDYVAHQRIEDPVFGVAIHRNDGLHIWGTNTFLAEFPIAAIEGAGQVRYQIETLPLQEGTYFLSVAVHNATDTRTFDYQNLMHRFRVALGEERERYGAIYIPSRWEHGASHGPEGAPQG